MHFDAIKDQPPFRNGYGSYKIIEFYKKGRNCCESSLFTSLWCTFAQSSLHEVHFTLIRFRWTGQQRVTTQSLVMVVELPGSCHPPPCCKLWWPPWRDHDEHYNTYWSSAWLSKSLSSGNNSLANKTSVKKLFTSWKKKTPRPELWTTQLIRHHLSWKHNTMHGNHNEVCG